MQEDDSESQRIFSSAMSTETPEAKEAKELALVGKVELRIALTDTDTKLESILKTYLAPLLLKLGSEFLSVRKKVCCLIAAALSSHTAFCASSYPCLYSWKKLHARRFLETKTDQL